jgi:hypothetical protein
MSTKREQVTFWEGWHRHAREPVGSLSAEQAERRERNGRLYLVLLGNPEQPRCFIEVNGDFFGVSFLDEKKREHLMYTFEELEPQKLFLSEAIYREFGASSTIVQGTAYRFTPGGQATVEHSEPPFNRSTITDVEIDVSKNWEPKPVFGDYASIARKER